MSENQTNKQGFWSRVFHLYYDGFRSMTVGKTLWLIIGIKLFQLTNEASAKMNNVQSLPCKEEEDVSQLSDRQTNN